MRDHPNVVLAILGDGPYLKDLDRLARDLGVSGQVEFVGKVPFDQVPDYLKGADLFCFSSLTETQGLVTVEAMAAGLPVVAVEATGTQDVIKDGENGLLTPDDSLALAQAITRVLKHPELRSRFQKASLDTARKYGIKTQAEKLVGVYEQAIQAQKEGRKVSVASDGKSRRPHQRRLASSD
jgi:glycosyltransferase involved in cell wall biosynthesis